jgi:putative DNA primase/helicase
LHDSIAGVAHENSYNPILDLARSEKWDRVGRVENLGISFFGALAQQDGRDITEYQREVWRVAILSALARARWPGCKVDTVLVLEGLTGIGKSKGLIALCGGPKYCHTSGVHPEGGADAREPLSKNWFIVLEEGAAFRKSTREDWKAFITQTHDEYRPKYARATKQFPRSCVFFATTNEIEYLNDPTGNRRFLPTPISDEAISTERIESARQQIFAEALERIEAGEKWWTTDQQLQDLINTIRKDRVSTDPLEDAIETWWRGIAATQRPKALTTTQIAIAISESSDRSAQTRIGGALRRLGWKLSPYNPRFQRTYSPPVEWLEMSQGSRANILSVVRPVQSTFKADK